MTQLVEVAVAVPKSASKGFTLVELLVVMAILGILATVTLANFRTSQMKARDVQRKANLHQIATALEAYVGDHGGYPSSENGKIKACGCKASLSADLCDWGGEGSKEFCDEYKTVYLQEVPGDPARNQSYCYSSEGSLFKLYAKLENTNDPEAKGPYTCGGDSGYNFGLSSRNTSL